MTKPEGPAQGQAENYCCDNGNFGEPHECQKQPGATPAPSQPAGARELMEAAGIMRSGGEYYRVTGKACPNDYERLSTEQLLEIFAQQTAAKDAALEAAERERDSLRAENAALKAGKDGQQ